MKELLIQSYNDLKQLKYPLLKPSEIIHFKDNFALSNIDELLSKFNPKLHYDDSLILYRGICNSNSYNLGVCWTEDIKQAWPYRTLGNNKTYNVYEAIIDINDIDWYSTIQKRYSIWQHEKEYIVKPNSQIQLLSISTYRSPCQTLLNKYETKLSKLT